MAELADALDLGSSVNRRAGSTPVIRIAKALVLQGLFVFYDFISCCIILFEGWHLLWHSFYMALCHVRIF